MQAKGLLHARVVQQTGNKIHSPLRRRRSRQRRGSCQARRPRPKHCPRTIGSRSGSSGGPARRSPIKGELMAGASFPQSRGLPRCPGPGVPEGVRTPDLLIRCNSIDPTPTEAARPQAKPGQPFFRRFSSPRRKTVSLHLRAGTVTLGDHPLPYPSIGARPAAVRHPDQGSAAGWRRHGAPMRRGRQPQRGGGSDARRPGLPRSHAPPKAFPLVWRRTLPAELRRPATGFPAWRELACPPCPQ